MATKSLKESMGGIQKRADEVRTARRTMHSEMHALAKDVSEYCGEPRLFAQYLGRIKAIGLGRAYRAFSDLKDGRRRHVINEPGKWWMWRTKNLQDAEKVS
ncbi:MAG TPA: hypothetical protein VJ553_02690 [Candidatus Paceibacterota bacterium]|nr:hypothetical protein [Candidatus Paceibacterota bacterium]